MTDLCPTCRGSFPHAPGYQCVPVADLASPQPDTGGPYAGTRTAMDGPIAASPQPDTAPRMMQGIWPKEVGADTVCLADLPDTAPEGPTVRMVNEDCMEGDCEDSPAPGEWCSHTDIVSLPEAVRIFVREEMAMAAPHGYMPGPVADRVAERVAAALNGAPATDSERAVIDAADAVARLRSERNKNDG